MRSSHDPNARHLLALAQKVDADLLLQSEIDMAFDTLMGELPFVTALRVAGILAAVLTPSWSEHRRFQEEVLFPILATERNQPDDFVEFAGRIGDVHVEIGEHQREVSISLKHMAIDGRPLTSSRLDLIEQTLALRRRHHAAENAIDLKIPKSLGDSSRDILWRWTARQGVEPFPVNLIAKLWD